MAVKAMLQAVFSHFNNRMYRLGQDVSTGFCGLHCVRPHNMNVLGPLNGIESQCEQVLQTLPRWFGDEESLIEYARNTGHLPTFVAQDQENVVGFLSLREHFQQTWEIDCIAINSEARGTGLGRKIHEFAERWLVSKGAVLLQVKTLAETHPSQEYRETRMFYTSLGYIPVETFPSLWARHLPVLQLVKVLSGEA